MSTDTAFALGLLALVGPRFPDRLRAFMLTVVVVDDILALVVIALVYTDEVNVSALLVALVLFGVVLAAKALRVAGRQPHDFMPQRFGRSDECQDVGIGAQDGETHEGKVGKGECGVRGVLVVNVRDYLAEMDYRWKWPLM